MRKPRAKLSKQKIIIGVMVLFAVSGSVYAFSSHAATAVASAEVENGKLVSGATVISDATASGGKAITFVAATVTPAGGMQPPAGANLVKDLTRRSYWSDESTTATVNEISEKGPGGDVVIRNTVVDGQTGATSAVPNERSDLQGGSVPLNSTRWMIWYERFVTLPTTSLDRWQIMGPNEIHDSNSGLPQATVMPEVSPVKHRRLNANAGQALARYFDMGAITLGQWHQEKFGVYYTNGSNGWIEWWEDGVRKIRIDGQTTSEAKAGYWKFGNYRNADINGTSTVDISGTKVYD